MTFSGRHDQKLNKVYEGSLLYRRGDTLVVRYEDGWYCYPLHLDNDITGLELEEVLESGYLVRKLIKK